MVAVPIALSDRFHLLPERQGVENALEATGAEGGGSGILRPELMTLWVPSASGPPMFLSDRFECSNKALNILKTVLAIFRESFADDILQNRWNLYIGIH